MTSKSMRMLGHIVLAIAVLILLVTMAGMAKWIPKYWATQPMILFAFILTLLARKLRKRGDGSGSALDDRSYLLPEHR